MENKIKGIHVVAPNVFSPCWKLIRLELIQSAITLIYYNIANLLLYLLLLSKIDWNNTYIYNANTNILFIRDSDYYIYIPHCLQLKK